MNIDFAGTELEAFRNNSSFVVESTAAAGSWDSACVRCAILAGRGGYLTEYVETPDTTPRTTSWTHFEHWHGASVVNSWFIRLYNSAGTVVFQIIYSAVNTLQAQYWNGSAFVNIGPTAPIIANNKYTFDLKVVCGAAGGFELWANGTTLILSGSASMAAVDNVVRRRWSPPTNNTTSTNNLFISQVIVSEQCTIGHRYYSKAPTGNGANTGWTGDYTAVDEVVLSNADFIEGTVENSVETFTGPAVTIPSGVVKAVVVSGQLKNSAGGPQNAQAALRKAGVNYFSANIAGVSTVYGPAQAIFHNDPGTGVGWALSDAVAASLEFGFKAAA